MNNKYTLEELTKTFADHCEVYETQSKKHAEKMLEEDPSWEAPEGFNLAKALSVICWEIERLKSLL